MRTSVFFAAVVGDHRGFMAIRRPTALAERRFRAFTEIPMRLRTRAIRRLLTSYSQFITCVQPVIIENPSRQMKKIVC
jgi:hypothetical protein